MSASPDVSEIVAQTIVPHTAYEYALERLEYCFKYSAAGSMPVCLAIIGESRCGKSAVLNEFVEQHPRSRPSTGALVPVLKVIADQAPTVKNITEAMLIELGDPIVKRATGARLMQALIKLLQATQTKVIVIDEFQHFQEKHSSKILHEVADFLKNLVERTNISLVVAGLPTCLAVVRSNPQLANRFSAPVVMPRFDWNDEGQRRQFMWIMSSFEVTIGSHFTLPSLADTDMAYRFHHASGGAIGNAARILEAAVRSVSSTGGSAIRLEDFHAAFNTTVFHTSLANPFSRDFCTQADTAMVRDVRDTFDCVDGAQIGTSTRRQSKGFA